MSVRIRHADIDMCTCGVPSLATWQSIICPPCDEDVCITERELIPSELRSEEGTSCVAYVRVTPSGLCYWWNPEAELDDDEWWRLAEDIPFDHEDGCALSNTCEHACRPHFRYLRFFDMLMNEIEAVTENIEIWKMFRQRLEGDVHAVDFFQRGEWRTVEASVVLFMNAGAAVEYILRRLQEDQARQDVVVVSELQKFVRDSLQYVLTTRPWNLGFMWDLAVGWHPSSFPWHQWQQ